MIETRQRLALADGAVRSFCSLAELEQRGMARIARLPVSLRILLESVVRHLDGDASARTSRRPSPGCRSTS